MMRWGTRMCSVFLVMIFNKRQGLISGVLKIGVLNIGDKNVRCM